jgi:outer membrane scaffolding protein for murein synthesis (MipA/OmpV family)
MFINTQLSHSTRFSSVKKSIFSASLMTGLIFSPMLVSAQESQQADTAKVKSVKDSQNNSVEDSQNYEELPLWELGLGIGGLHQPYYVGTKQNRTFAFPAPMPIYRGKVIKSDDEGVRAELFNSENFKLEFSLDFNLAVDSDDVDLRIGMPDIDSRLQIGPSLEVKLAHSDHSQWQLNFPIRASIGIGDDGLDESGVTFAPNVTYFRDFDWSGTPWRAGVALGPQFGSRDYQNLYYGVDQAFATDTREAYSADSGYSGSRLLMTLRSQNRQRLWVWFVRYENISGATFEDSPLVETNDGLSVGLIFSKFLFKSKETVRRKK